MQCSIHLLYPATMLPVIHISLGNPIAVLAELETLLLKLNRLKVRRLSF
jgi:hypothetical protein